MAERLPKLKNIRLSWLIGGGLTLLLLLGLFYDVWRSYAVRTSLQATVRTVAHEAATGFLPFRPREALKAAMRGLEQRGIKPDPGSVTVAPDGYSLKISVYSDVMAYFAWIVGNPRMQFQAAAEAVVSLEGGGPVAALPRGDVAFALARSEDLLIGQNLVVMPSGALDLPEYAIKAWRIVGPEQLTVNAPATFEPLSSLKEIASHRDAFVAILKEMEGSTGVVQGFGLVAIDQETMQGGLSVRFMRSQVDGEAELILPGEHNFGLYQGGVPKVTIQ